MIIRQGLLACALFAMPGSLTASSDHPTEEAAQKATYFPQNADGANVLDAALADARASGKTALVVFGADWCHDSRSLADVLSSSAFTGEFGSRYSVTFIDVGRPQTGEGRNLDLMARFGVKRMKGTPAMFAISPQGERINSKKDAVSWRNAHSRGEAAILGWIRNLQDED
jgi:thiol-disulfide isomerase/thioredoxin